MNAHLEPQIRPICGQVHHFYHLKQEVPYAQERFKKENRRLYGVLDQQLSKEEYIAGNYSIEDISTWPWVTRFN